MSALRRSQRTKSKPDVLILNTSNVQKKNTVKLKYIEKKNTKFNKRDLSNTDNLEEHFLTPFYIKPFGCKICKKRFDSNDSFKKHILFHFRRNLNSPKLRKLRKESLKHIENIRVKKAVSVKDIPEIVSVKDEPKSVSVKDIPETILVKDIPKTILVNDEPETILVKDEPKIVSVKDEPKMLSVKDEPKIVSVKDLPETSLIKDEIVLVKDIPKTILVNDEPETILVKDKPAIVSVKDIPETVSVKNKPKVPDTNAKKFDHVIKRVNNVVMITIPEYPDIKIKMVKGEIDVLVDFINVFVIKGYD
ncbi:unnamed protein product [Psylliodes chrysocephalus]|uniref:C2H2-type domain-containing protein n=1 Tax=Psylliodes chrysocephalus TaxID=3402493 RepID=A0A9P0GDS8_9CUCU|nr:unnamed protein product [Psylliodes chrysocephala]